LNEDILYTLDQMEKIFEDYQLDSIIVEGGKEYQILLNNRVKKDLEDGKITLNSIECSLLNIPDSVFKQINCNEDFLIDCREINMRLVLSKKGQTLEVLVVRPIGDFPIY